VSRIGSEWLMLHKPARLDPAGGMSGAVPGAGTAS
jgi:hypothetical protein